MIIIIVRKSGQISCVPMLYYDRNVVFFFFYDIILFGNVFYVCLILFAVYIYCIFIYLFFPGRFEQTARRTHGRDGRTRIGRRALPVQKRTFQNDRYRQVSRLVIRLYYTYRYLYDLIVNG